jgi:hypothetical protein
VPVIILNFNLLITIPIKKYSVDCTFIYNLCGHGLQIRAIGFSNTFEDVYRYDGLVVHDLKPRNVLKDKYGDIYVIDAEFIQDAELPIFQIII